MIKSKFALIIDSLFLSVILSITSLLWLRKILKNAILVSIFAIFIFLLSFALILFLFFKSNNKKIFDKNNSSFLNNCLNKLTISPMKEYTEFLCKLIGCKHIEGFLFKFKNNYLYINIKTELSSQDYFLAQEIILKNSTEKSNLYFIYRTKNKSFDEILLLTNFNIHLLEIKVISTLMTTKNIFPLEKSISQKSSFKNKFLNKLKTSTEGITKNHFKELFFSGISLLFLSLIVPFSNYYLISGTLLLIIAIISLFKKNYKKAENDSDFLLKQ